MKKLCILFFLAMFFPARAADLGVDGEIWPITEPDLLEAIHAELNRAAADGRLARFNDRVANQGQQALMSPPSLGLPRARQDRSWLHDPTMIVQRDILTHQGVLIAAAGTRINPLEHVPLREPLIFIDGSDPRQVRWGLEQAGKIILTGGQPKALMERHKRRMYLDQKGVLTSRFRITALPGRVRQDGLLLLIEEVFLEGDEK